MTIIDILGWGNMLLFSIVTLPQLFKTLKTKKVEDVSVAVYWLIVIANIDAWFYAFLIHQTPLLAKYTFGLLSAIIYLVAYYKIKKRKLKHA
jgi:uncharacterized protein with PQ loop repeat